MYADPKVVDTQLAAAYETAAKLSGMIAGFTNLLHQAVGDKKEWIGKQSYWAMKDRVVEGMAREAKGIATYDVVRVRQALEGMDTLRSSAAVTRTEIAELDALYTGWSRFFLVTGGHIHSSQHCSTCYPTTQIGWLPQLSGETEADAVAEHGALLCTVCYPTAPVEWTNKYEVDAATRKAAQCPGSGTYDYEPVRYHRAYQRCPHCEKMVSTTSTGKMRSHKP